MMTFLIHMDDGQHYSDLNWDDKNFNMDIQASNLQTLHRIPWFNELSPAALEKLARITSVRNLEAGDILFNEGDAENCMYVLLAGEVELETRAPGFGKINIFIAEPLDIIGWSSLTPVVRQRTDTAFARCPCMLVSFNSDLLRQLCDEDYETGYVIMRRIANVAASRLLTTRLHLFEVINKQSDQLHQRNCNEQD